MTPTTLPTTLPAAIAPAVDTGNIWFLAVYLVYGFVSIALTVFLARTFFRYGAVFLRDVYADQPDMANAMNRLLVTGFYLFNLGYAFLVVNTVEAQTAGEAARAVVNRLGVLLVSLAAIHFVNLAVFSRIRLRHELRHMAPPIAARAWAPPPPPQPQAQPQPTAASIVYGAPT